MSPPISKIRCLWEFIFLGFILKINGILFKKYFGFVAMLSFPNFCELPISKLYDMEHLNELGISL